MVLTVGRPVRRVPVALLPDAGAERRRAGVALLGVGGRGAAGGVRGQLGLAQPRRGVVPGGREAGVAVRFRAVRRGRVPVVPRLCWMENVCNNRHSLGAHEFLSTNQSSTACNVRSRFGSLRSTVTV